MMRATSRLPGLLAFLCLAATGAHAEKLNDLYFGEALFHAHQGHFFEALERLDTEVRQHSDVDEPQRDSLFAHINDAEFSLGDFELRYRMHHRAGRAIKAVLDGAVAQDIRNDAAYRLARIHFQKNQMDEAIRALARIDGTVPPAIRDDVEFLRANVYLAQQQPSAAVAVLKRLQDSGSFGGFAAYNLGIAYLQNGQTDAAMTQLDRAGQNDSKQPADLAIRDKSNLVLGTMLLEAGEHGKALPYLNRVRLDGPFSNQALLSAGWASLSGNDLERAVVPWSLLAQREATDPATQEAMLALPYAYSQLNVFGRAAVAYGDALDAFGAEVGKLDASIASIRDGKFLKALVREEIRQNKDWVIRLRSLPETPETYYLMQLLASHDFQTGLQNYLDLADLRRKLLAWQAGLDAYEDMVAIRRTHYAPLLPTVDDEFRALDSKMRLRVEQHKTLVKRRDDLLTTPRPEFLATRDEQADLNRLERIETRLRSNHTPAGQALKDRVRRLKGMLAWTLQTQYHERLTQFDANLRDLDQVMTKANAQYARYVRARQAATHSHSGFSTPIDQLRAEAATAVQKIDGLMQRQGDLLEVVAIEELMVRRARLENYGDKARFALADSYDRATQSQASRAEP